MCLTGSVHSGAPKTPPSPSAVRLALILMVIAALVVAIVSAGFSGWSVIYARSSARAATGSARSAAITAGHDSDRRHAELTPRFRITVEPANPGIETLRMKIYLVGPAELGRLDELSVVIRNDHPWRAEHRPLAHGPTPEQVAEQIWGRWMFTPGVGPNADLVRHIPGADSTGRNCPTSGMPVGEELPFQLDPTQPPSWSHQPIEAWRDQMGPLLRLQLECRRDGHEPWSLPVEMRIDHEGFGFANVPNAHD